jgi:tetratricopeptide (TPR) repeat protein
MQQIDDGIKELKALKEEFPEKETVDKIDWLIQAALEQKERNAEAVAKGNPILIETPERLALAEKSPFFKAELFYKHKMYAEAEEILTSIINSAILPYNGSVESNISVKVDCEKTINLDYLYSSRAYCRYDLKLFDKALIDFKESYRLDNDPEMLLIIAHCLYEQRMYDEAIEKYDEYLEKASPDRTGQYLAKYKKAICMFRKGKLKASGLSLLKLKKEFPEREDEIQKALNETIRISNKYKKDHPVEKGSKKEKGVGPMN